VVRSSPPAAAAGVQLASKRPCESSAEEATETAGLGCSASSHRDVPLLLLQPLRIAPPTFGEGAVIQVHARFCIRGKEIPLIDLLQLQTKKRAPSWAASEQFYVSCNIVAAVKAALREGGGPSECHRPLKPAAEHTKCSQQKWRTLPQQLEGNRQ